MRLTHGSIGNPEPGEVGHVGGDDAGFFAKFAAGHLFNVYIRVLPAALREFVEAFLYGVAELAYQPDEVAFGRVLHRDNDAGWVFVHHAVETAFAVAAFDDIFADAGPGIAIDFATADRLNGHFLPPSPYYPTLPWSKEGSTHFPVCELFRCRHEDGESHGGNID